MPDHDTHDHTGVPGVGTPADILDIPTAETDDTLVLAPDGAGGVEFRAEAGGSGNYTLITDTTLGSDTANFDFTSISGSFKHLVLEFQLRSDRASNEGDAVKVILNNDTSSIYDYTLAQIDGSSWQVSRSSAQAAMNLFEATAANATAGAAASGRLMIENYAGTSWHKVITADATTPLNTSDGGIRRWTCGGRWRSTSAITRITVAPVNGSNFKQNSRMTLYGIS